MITIISNLQFYDFTKEFYIFVQDIAYNFIRFTQHHNNGDNYYYWYSALGPVWAETRVQSGDWYGF